MSSQEDKQVIFGVPAKDVNLVRFDGEWHSVRKESFVVDLNLGQVSFIQGESTVSQERRVIVRFDAVVAVLVCS